MTTGIIYKATSPSGKSYIGKTVTSLAKRKSDHKTQRKCPLFIRALDKYGDDIKWEVLHKDVPVSCLNTLERLEILRHNTLTPNGYNLTLGGDGGIPTEEVRRKMSENHADMSGENNPFFGRKHTAESKRKISENNAWKGKSSPMKNKTHTEETKQKISQSKKGKRSLPLGFKHSKETKARMSKAKKGKPWTPARRAAEINKGKIND